MKKSLANHFTSRIDIPSACFYCALILFCAYSMIANITLYYEMPELITSTRKILRYLILGLLVAKFIMGKKYNRSLLIYFIVFALVCVIDYLLGEYNILILTVAIIFCATDVDFDKICWIIFWNIVIWGVVIASLCGLGFLNDYTYVHNIGERVVTAHSWGFLAYNHVGYMIMAASLLWIYLRKECSYFELFLIAALNCVLYLFHTTRLSIVVVLAFIVVYIVMIKWNFFKIERFIYKLIATIAPFGIFAVIIGLLMLYANGGIPNTFSFLSTVLARFEFSVFYLEKYGVHLFGTEVEMNGIQDYYYNNAEDNVYIDCGYIYILIAYGIVLTILILTAYALVFRYLWKSQNKKGYLWILAMLCACAVNNFIINLVFNPILFLLPRAITNQKKSNDNSS